MVRCNAGGVGSATRLRPQFLIKKAAFFCIAGEDLSLVDILVTYRRSEVFPTGTVRIDGRLVRIQSDMAGCAGNSDAIRPDKAPVVVVAWVVQETITIPFPASFFVEFRFWEKPEANHSRRLAVNFLIDASWFGRSLLIEHQS